jgi:hypothetical protein
MNAMTTIISSNWTNGGSVNCEDRGWRLAIPPGPARQYRLAQLDDYTGLTRRQFPSHPPRTLSLRARVSAGFSAGTWGFGFWNDPFGFALGLDGNPARLPALPNAAWFFFASPHNHLSFQPDKPAQGFLAQTFRAPGFHPLLAPAALAFPFARPTTHKLLGRVIEGDGVALRVDPAEWHAYKLRWDRERVIFEVDAIVVLETSITPKPPLGLVIWIDNQYAAFTANGKLAWGTLECDQAAALEIEALELK